MPDWTLSGRRLSERHWRKYVRSGPEAGQKRCRCGNHLPAADGVEKGAQDEGTAIVAQSKGEKVETGPFSRHLVKTGQDQGIGEEDGVVEKRLGHMSDGCFYLKRLVAENSVMQDTTLQARQDCLPR